MPRQQILGGAPLARVAEGIDAELELGIQRSAIPLHNRRQVVVASGRSGLVDPIAPLRAPDMLGVVPRSEDQVGRGLPRVQSELEIGTACWQSWCMVWRAIPLCRGRVVA